MLATSAIDYHIALKRILDVNDCRLKVQVFRNLELAIEEVLFPRDTETVTTDTELYHLIKPLCDGLVPGRFDIDVDDTNHPVFFTHLTDSNGSEYETRVQFEGGERWNMTIRPLA
jgi:hypothetical protein